MFGLRRFVFVLFTGLIVIVGAAGMEAPKKLDFATISGTEARAIASSVDTGQKAQEVTEAAIASGRHEILDICWEFPFTRKLLTEHMRSLPPDSAERDRLLVMLLRNPRTYWVPERTPGRIPGPRDHIYARDAAALIVPMLRKYLPDVPMDYGIIGTKEKRLALAAEYAKAAGILLQDPADARRIWPSTKKQDRPSVGAPKDGEISSPIRTDGEVPDTVAAFGDLHSIEAAPVGWALWSGIGALVVLAAGWMFLRNKGKSKRADEGGRGETGNR